MGKLLKYIAEETQGACFTSFKYCYDTIIAPAIEYGEAEKQTRRVTSPTPARSCITIAVYFLSTGLYIKNSSREKHLPTRFTFLQFFR